MLEALLTTHRDFGGLNIRFVEDEGLRQQRRVIYHEFQNEWGVEQLKSGPNDGALYLCCCVRVYQDDELFVGGWWWFEREYDYVLEFLLLLTVRVLFRFWLLVVQTTPLTFTMLLMVSVYR